MCTFFYLKVHKHINIDSLLLIINEPSTPKNFVFDNQQRLMGKIETIVWKAIKDYFIKVK